MVNIFGPAMGALFRRPLGTKKANKMPKQEADVASPNPSLLEIASAHKTIFYAQAAITSSLSYNDKSQWLETELKMLMEMKQSELLRRLAL
jgi:hypothetical protein